MRVRATAWSVCLLGILCSLSGRSVQAEGLGESLAPASCALHQNYPNPFNPSTVIRYDLSRAGTVRLTVYNLLGEEVALLALGAQAAGTYSVRFNAADLPTGAYLYRLEVQPASGGAPFIATRKFVLTR